jgi:hypothetical protein
MGPKPFKARRIAERSDNQSAPDQSPADRQQIGGLAANFPLLNRPPTEEDLERMDRLHREWENRPVHEKRLGDIAHEFEELLNRIQDLLDDANGALQLDDPHSFRLEERPEIEGRINASIGALRAIIEIGQRAERSTKPKGGGGRTPNEVVFRLAVLAGVWLEQNDGAPERGDQSRLVEHLAGIADGHIQSNSRLKEIARDAIAAYSARKAGN